MARKTYNDEFKIAAAKLVREPGYTVKKAAQSLGVDPGSIRTWAQKYAPAAIPPGPVSRRGHLQGPPGLAEWLLRLDATAAVPQCPAS